MIASGSSERGLSEVTIVTSARSAAILPISGRFPRSRSPPAPKTTITRPGPSPRAALKHRREGVRRVRVVDDDGERLSLVDGLEASRDTVQARDPFRDRVLVEVEQHAGRDGSEHVLDVERPHAGASRCRCPAARNRLPCASSTRFSGLISASCVDPEADERRTVEIRKLVGESAPPLVADVDRSRRRRRAREQSSLRVEVVVHRPVQVEVVLAQVREHERVEANAVEPSKRRPVRARLHGGAAVAGVEHFAEEALQVDRLRRRERSGSSLSRDLPLDGTDEAGTASRGREDRAQQKGGRRLPVRSGHARELELLRRLAEEDVRSDGHGLPRRDDDELRHVDVEDPLDDQRQQPRARSPPTQGRARRPARRARRRTAHPPRPCGCRTRGRRW